jgi:hypothetical protein
VFRQYDLCLARMDTLANDARNRRFELLAMPHLDAAFNLARWLTGNTADAEAGVLDREKPEAGSIAGLLPAPDRPVVMSLGNKSWNRPVFYWANLLPERRSHRG